MRVNSLTLANFRNYPQLTVSLNPGVNLIVGNNGQGKTNLVEAIRYCSTLSSHRSPSSALIMSEKPQASIGLEIQSESKILKLGIELNKESSNRHSLNGNVVSRSSDVLGALTTVIFSPEDIDLIRRDPTTRRSFLNDLSIQLRPAHYSVIQDYEKVLKQRNALLKSARGKLNIDLSTLELWDEKLVSLGVKIILNRESLIAAISPGVRNKYAQIAQSDVELELKQVSGMGIDYQGQDESTLTHLFTDVLQQRRKEELEKGVTLVGPQRDDLLIGLNGLSAKEHASQGEAWSLALALKLASAELMAESSSTGKPVLILDDVFSVLDSNRRKSLTEFIDDYEQVLITAAVEDDVPLTSTATRFVAAGGNVE